MTPEDVQLLYDALDHVLDTGWHDDCAACRGARAIRDAIDPATMIWPTPATEQGRALRACLRPRAASPSVSEARDATPGGEDGP